MQGRQTNRRRGIEGTAIARWDQREVLFDVECQNTAVVICICGNIEISSKANVLRPWLMEIGKGHKLQELPKGRKLQDHGKGLSIQETQGLLEQDPLVPEEPVNVDGRDSELV